MILRRQLGISNLSNIKFTSSVFVWHFGRALWLNFLSSSILLTSLSTGVGFSCLFFFVEGGRGGRNLKTCFRRISSKYKSRKKSTINLYVPNTQLQQLQIHGHYCFIYATPIFPHAWIMLKQIPDISIINNNPIFTFQNL